LHLIELVKRKWLRLVRVAKKSLYISERKDMGIIILQLLENLFELDISAVQLNQNLQLVIGLAKNFGQGQGVLQRVRQKIGKENISIFV
jgi:hypothetical protein